MVVNRDISERHSGMFFFFTPVEDVVRQDSFVHCFPLVARYYNNRRSFDHFATINFPAGEHAAPLFRGLEYVYIPTVRIFHYPLSSIENTAGRNRERRVYLVAGVFYSTIRRQTVLPISFITVRSEERRVGKV